MHALVVLFDEEADSAVRALWRRLGATSEFPPHVTWASATAIGPRVRAELAADLEHLWLPDLWLRTLGSSAESEPSLDLTAVVDAELLAVHSAIHDVLAGRVRNPTARHLPGSWTPRCTLLKGEPAEVSAAFAKVNPVPPIRARVRELSVLDTQTGGVSPLKKASTAPR